MRGKGENKWKICNGKRITPAYAGKSWISTKLTPPSEDHPRLCGEKYKNRRRSPLQRGSPPPMRGKVTVTQGQGQVYRITPAYAGKRLCDGVPLFFCSGSPPPMRGKASHNESNPNCCRITPAYAGKSYSAVQQHLVCHGSPPPMRGKEKN